MAKAHDCPECGGVLKEHAPLGLCPRCLLKLGMDEGPPPTSDYVSPSLAAGPRPEHDALAALFPQLEVLEPLGRGGMGMVYKARQIKLDRLVALKVIRPESAAVPSFSERFQREARAMARLNHPHIAALYDFGETDGLCHLLMELVEGEDLRKRLQRGRFTIEATLLLAFQICDALQYAHERGVVHRDIKPENVLIDPVRGVKIVDFGLAKLLEPGEGDSLTATRHVLGTPRYMAPEQLEAPRTVDHRADIYAFGLLIYEMLTGEVPFGRYELLSERVEAEEELDNILAACLARDPKDRYASVSALRRDLAEYAEAYYDLTDAHAELAVPVPSAPLAVAAVTKAADSEETWWWVALFVLALGWAYFHNQFLDQFEPGWPKFGARLAWEAMLAIGIGAYLATWSRFPGWHLLIVFLLGAPYASKGVTENLAAGTPRLIGSAATVGAVLLGVLAWWIRWWHIRRRERLEAGEILAGSTVPDRAPALGLVAVGGLNGLMLPVFLVHSASPTSPIRFLGEPIQPVGALVFGLWGAVLGASIAYCGLRWLAVRSRAHGWVGAVLAMAPLGPGCLLGIPVGIWVLAVLTRPETAPALAPHEKAAPVPDASAIVGDTQWAARP